MIPNLHKRCLSWLCLAGHLTLVGCANPWGYTTASNPYPLINSNAEVPLPAESRVVHTTFDTAAARSENQATAAADSSDIEQLVYSVRQKVAMTVSEEQELRSELGQCRADEQTAVMKRFCSTLAYRQQLQAREQTRLDLAIPDHDMSAARPVNTSQAPSAVQSTNFSAADVGACDSAIQLVSHNRDIEPARETASLPQRGSTIANPSHGNQSLAAPSPTELASHQSQSGDSTWQEHLDSAIEELAEHVPAEPGSVDEVADHMKLRMLNLMAGNQEAALKPLPGASTAEQDFWSKQLFALSTYLDINRQPDRKRRAAGALLHLDQARSRLAEIASLQISNAIFVSSVDGFGLYEPLEKTTFEPGQQVAIYAEVENFRSESTKDGFRTSLSTSYEVLDPQGRRVEGAQFPEVEDLCRNLRHDFHMQYGVLLPTRIYPGEYELRLTITDQLSNKIAQASIPFEIAE